MGKRDSFVREENGRANKRHRTNGRNDEERKEGVCCTYENRLYFERATGRGEAKNDPMVLKSPHRALASLFFPLLREDSETPPPPIVAISVPSRGFFFCPRICKFGRFSWSLPSSFPKHLFNNPHKAVFISAQGCLNCFAKPVSNPHKAVFIVLRNHHSTVTLS